jgi:hypothetical protein
MSARRAGGSIPFAAEDRRRSCAFARHSKLPRLWKRYRYSGRFAMQVSGTGDKAVNPQRQIAQALAGSMVDRIGERR